MSTDAISWINLVLGWISSSQYDEDAAIAALDHAKNAVVELKAQLAEAKASIALLSKSTTFESGAHGVTNLRGPLVLKHGDLCVGCQQVRDTVIASRKDQGRV